MDDQNRNLILATALSFLVILIWFLLFPPEEPPQRESPQAPTAAAPERSAPTIAPAPPAAATTPDAVSTPDTPLRSAEEAPRLEIDTPRLAGSISLRGGRIDDLELTAYDETLATDSPNVSLLSPVGGDRAYYALHGWAPGGELDYAQVPGADTQWELTSSGPLTPQNPATLEWDNGAGLVFRRTISVDDNYLFTIAQSVENTGESAKRLAPYGIVARHGLPETVNFFILHEGVVRLNDDELEEIDYNDMPDLDYVEREGTAADVYNVEQDGWVGFTDKYWMTALLPPPGQPFQSVVKHVPGPEIYQTETRLPTMTVAPGERAAVTTYLFAGAKEWEAITAYQEQMGFSKFVDSIDWGWFFFLTKPIFWLLHEINLLIGNMGWSIIILTLIIKAVLLPLAYKSYASMARMKELQPEMEKLKERAGDDKMKMQKEMMELYKREKVNPASGCLPILLQIPIFFSLYKVIFVTIELRHAPWFGPFRDLSAPDPTSLLNLWGLLPFAPPDPESFLALIFIGILPLFLGISMWLQQKLNPAPTDPTQAMIFAWMPWVFMFMLGTFASGLVLYWIANNVITFAQQYAIMRSQGYKPDLFGNIRSSFKRRKPDAK